MQHQTDVPVGSDSRTSILDAAEKLFAERGYDGTSTASIAKAAGVTRTLIFHYFPTKQAILDTLLHTRGPRVVLDEVAVPRDTNDVRTALLALAAQIHDRLSESDRLLQIILRERGFQPLARGLYVDFLDRLDSLVHATVATTLDREPAASTRAVADTFAAALLRDILLQPTTGIMTVDCERAAQVCALALAGEATARAR